MKRSLFFTCFIISIFLGNNILKAQSLNLPGSPFNILPPVLIGESSPDGADLFNVTGSGYNNGSAIFVDSYDTHFILSLTGGSYQSSLTFYADASGNVNQDIYVKFTPTEIGSSEEQTLDFYCWNPYSGQTMKVQGFGKGPEMKMEGRETGSDPWDEILDGETTPTVSEGTDFGDALVGTAIVDRIYRISNTAIGGKSGDLVLTEYETNKYIQILGTNANQFSVTVEPSTPIDSAGGTTTYTVRFDPTSAGIKTAEISIGNNDPEPNSENPYNFAIKGNGTVLFPVP